MVMPNRNFELGGANYRYGFNGQEKDDEVAGAGNINTAMFWEYDTRLGRRWNLDPKPFAEVSSYACFGNNPIWFTDPLGDTLRGVSKVSTQRLKNEVDNSFQGDEAKDLRDLFKIGKDGTTFINIKQQDLDNSIKDLTEDQQALARAYATAVNSQSAHYVDVTKRGETLNQKSTDALGLTKGTKGEFVDTKYGGEVNIGYGNGSLSVIVIDSKATIDFVYSSNSAHYKRNSTPAELISHEVLGHGLGRSLGTSTYRHEDAIRMTNLYWRARGYKSFYRDGTYHGTQKVLTKGEATKIPTQFK